MIMKKYIVILITLLVFTSEMVFSQSLSVNMGFLNEYYRRQQLLGNIDPSISFTNRPLFSETLNIDNIYDPESRLETIRKINFDGMYKFHKGKGKFQLLPISLLNQYNSHHPEGINDGSMIPSRGTQMRVSAGFYFKYGPLSIKLKPEFIYAQNKVFDGFPQNHTTYNGIKFPISPYRGIDLPERYGFGAYNKAFIGQSSIRLTFGPVSFGLSNENLWWGPGYRNSLLMTNSASGFMHLTFNTVKPIKTFLGFFEVQILGGKLKDSGLTEGLTNDWRYLNSMVLTYQPRWIKGLFLGFVRSFLVYHEEMGSSFNDYLPVISPFTKSNSGSSADEVELRNRNQLISIFMRWVFVKSSAEVYFEYGREDHSWDLRDFLLEPSHSSTYIIGMRKLYKLNSKSSHIQLILEASHLAANQTTINRDPPSNKISSWYTHGKVKHGYTHMGQLIGAGIGPGGNLQTIDISWCQNLNQIGLRLERYVHNNDFWYDYVQDIRSNWVDISYTAYANWNFKNFLISLKLKHVNSRNYQWLYEPIYEDIPEFWAPTKNTINFHTQLGITYRF